LDAVITTTPELSPRADWPEWLSTIPSLAWTLPSLPFLAAAVGFALLRVALQHSNAGRLLARTSSERKRAQLEPLLRRADRLATSARILETTCVLAFSALVLRGVAGEGPMTFASVTESLLIAVPVILLATEVLPSALALRAGDFILIHTLIGFEFVQTPLRWLVNSLEAARRVLMRVVGLRQNPASSRQIVEGLREVIEDAEISGDLDETEREIIGNVMEFRDVNVSAVMTPRTEIQGAEIGDGTLAAARDVALSGHSRIPIYDGSLDTIVGVVTARDLLHVAAEQGLAEAGLRSILRPAHFVPETKRLSELLAEFKREKIKLAIVLDEYGGTAGLVTLGDIIGEIVGSIQDEFDEEGPLPVRRLHNGTAEVDAGLRVSEVNQELSTEIPEGDDYETLAGFVLSELGHFPKRGEKFVAGGVEYAVLDASERRVHKVSIRPIQQRASA
jgi:CBS domain containing-hemolysin-like protein